MPYYNWVGIDLYGNTKKGIASVPSFDMLEHYLFEQEIGLLNAKVVQHTISKRWKSSDTLELFKQLNMLLSSGVFLTDALNILIKLSHKQYISEVLKQIAEIIYDGGSLHKALESLRDHFDPLIITMVKAGEESGNLVTALQSVCNHIESREAFHKKLRAAALTPAITFMFFIVIVLIIMIFVIPHFELLFMGHEAQIPAITRYIIHMSKYLTGVNIGLMMSVLMLGYILLRARQNVWKRSIDSFLLKIPFLKDIIIQSSMVSLLEPLSLLLQTGVPLLPALEIAQESVKNSVIHDSYRSGTQHIMMGDSLSQSLKESEQFIPFDLLAMIQIGEESGKLGVMLERCSRYYQEHVLRSLDIVTILFQPLLMIILGLLVAVLIFAVYMPLFELSNCITY